MNYYALFYEVVDDFVARRVTHSEMAIADRP
jgi:hypothetical protein